MNKDKEITKLFESKIIKTATYDPYMNVLSITFNNGIQYDYIDVSRDIFNEMCEAESAGKYFHKHIKNKFEFLKKGGSLNKKEKSPSKKDKEVLQEKEESAEPVYPGSWERIE
jgi:hypothetical protein